MIGVSREDLRPGSKLHDKILKALDVRYVASRKRMDRLHEGWRKGEETFIAYLPERDLDAARRLDRDQNGNPQYTTLMLPYTYALAMSAHSYWTTVFLARSPIFQFTGRHGESQQQIQALEALIDYQTMVGEMLVPMHLWLLDPAKYGIGLVGYYWDKEVSYSSSYEEIEDAYEGILPTGKTKKELVTREYTGYEGHRLYNIRPYDWYPDPRVALWEIQKAEFHGVYREIGWAELVKGAQNGSYTNIDVLRERKQKGEYGGTARVGEARAEQLALPNDELYNATDWDLQETGPWGIIEFYVNLAPKDWGLGESKYHEKWCFTATVKPSTRNQANTVERGNLDTIIAARPLGAVHGKFPLAILQMEPEAYAFTARSMTEILRPLQNAMDWLFNAHMFNVRKAMNNQFVVDPSRVVMSDLLDPLPGNIVRLKSAAFGSDTRTALTQLNVADVTRNHVNDIQTIHEFAQRAVGVTDQIMGMFDAGGRKSATEVRTSSTFGVNRQKTIAEYFSAMGFAPLAAQMVANTQQYYSGEKQFRIAGDLMLEAGNGLINVSPDRIAGAYDFVPVDGTLPIDRFAQTNLWREILIGVQNMPQIAAQYDMGRIFAWMAQLGGLKNITRFRTQVMPDQALALAAQRGDVVPLPTSRSVNATGVEPGQISGAGNTG